MADILYDTRQKSDSYPKVVILTHGDADGLVAATVVKKFEELENKNKVFLIMSSMDVTSDQTDKTMEYICKYTSLGKKDKVYICDRPLPSLDWLKMRYLGEAQLINIDHHLTNHPKLFEKEEFYKDVLFVWDDKVSAAYLALEYFNKNFQGEKFKKLYEELFVLVKATSDWDIFTWKSFGDSPKEKLLKRRALSINSAEKLLGASAFFNFINKKIDPAKYTEKVFEYFFLLDEAYSLKLKNVYNFTKRVIYDFKFKNYKFGVIYGIDGDYQSLMADKIFEDKRMDYEVVAFINVYGTVSFRSKNNIDVSEISKKLGDVVGFSGGGHKNASGCRIVDRDKLRERLIDVFENSMKQVELMI